MVRRNVFAVRLAFGEDCRGQVMVLFVLNEVVLVLVLALVLVLDSTSPQAILAVRPATVRRMFTRWLFEAFEHDQGLNITTPTWLHNGRPTLHPGSQPVLARR